MDQRKNGQGQPTILPQLVQQKMECRISYLETKTYSSSDHLKPTNPPEPSSDWTRIAASSLFANGIAVAHFSLHSVVEP
jgi:hypothetical protein